MKNEENAIEVRDVTKTFKVYYDKGTELKENCCSGSATATKTVWF